MEEHTDEQGRVLVPVRIKPQEAEKRLEARIEEVPENWNPQQIPRRWIV